MIIDLDAVREIAEDVTTVGNHILIHGDCRDILPHIQDKSAAIVSDPPYGVSLNCDYAGERTKSKMCNSHSSYEDIIDDDKPFDPEHLIRFKKCLLWGGNCFSDKLPVSFTWLAWDKIGYNDLKVRLSEVEFAWSNCTGKSRIFRHTWTGACRHSERATFVHPTQKPIELMAWCIRWVRPVPKWIIDPYMGSGSTGLGCIYENMRGSDFRFIGIEKFKDYYDVSVDRISKYIGQQTKAPESVGFF